MSQNSRSRRSQQPRTIGEDREFRADRPVYGDEQRGYRNDELARRQQSTRYSDNADDDYQLMRTAPRNITNVEVRVAPEINISQRRGNESRFDGDLGGLIGWSVFGFLLTLLTLGICYPFAVCKVYKWRIEHTIIDGNRLAFNGTATGLFGNWIKWFLLTIITFGIYSFFVTIKLEQWKVKHTAFKK